jgi:two-component system, chemotaxis family, response regulator WspR
MNVEAIKLLVIEDDPDQRQLLRETLEDRFGPETVVGADSLATAMQKELASFDLILTDYNLPDGTGIELLQRVRQHCKTPVIIVTGENVGRIAIEAVRKGATDYVVKFGDYLFTIPLIVDKNLAVAKMERENEKLRGDLEQALRDVRDKNAQLEISLKKVEELAATDPLTGLYNRRHFGRVLDQLFSEGERVDSDLSCVMIDLDGYKQLNDSFGHAVGDQLLVVAGRVIQANLRKMDIAARYGGDEFVLLLPHTSAEAAEGVAQRIREEFRQGSTIIVRRNEGVTMSLGIASRQIGDPASGEQLVMLADAALYRAKAGGKNRAVLHAPAK